MNNYSTTVQYGKEKIPFKVLFRDRKTLEIAVYPNSSVTVKAPKGTAPQKIEGRILKRARWIKKQFDFFRQFEPRTPSRRYVGGETHLYLGRQYRLKIRKRQNNGVKLKGAHFNVSTTDPRNRQVVKSLLDEWYKEHALSIFNKRLEMCHKSTKSLKVAYPDIKLRRMAKRWGSCSKSGNILLNIELIKAPLYSIDYVIMHELCHLKVHSHNNGYFKLLSKHMPDWERRKERLERAVI